MSNKYLALSLISALTFFLASPTALAQQPSMQTGFPVHLPNSNLVRAGSTTVVDLSGNGLPEIIVGDSQGKVHVLKDDGSVYWQYDTGNASIESKPAVADLNNDGFPEVVVSAGSTFTSAAVGSLTVLNGQTGAEICKYTPPAFGDAARGVFGSPAIANLDTSDPELEIAFGDWAATINVLNHDCSYFWKSRQSQDITGVPLEPDFNETTHGTYINDTIWSSPAIADVNGDGQLDIIIGTDAHTDDTGIVSQNGGRLLVINGKNGNLIFAKETDEVIWSSPAIADLNNDGSLDIIVGTGYCWQFAPCVPNIPVHNDGNQIYAWDANGNDLPGWPHLLENNYAIDKNSPAIADIDNDGFLEVVINTFDSSASPPYPGKVRAIDHNGVEKWATVPNIPAGGDNFVNYAANSASPIIADITADGDYEIVVPSNFDLAVYDKNGTQLFPIDESNRLLTLFTVSSTPSVADLDNDGDLELIVASSSISAGITPLPASIYAWDLATSSQNPQPWISFRNSVQNLGRFIIDFIFANGFESQ